MTSGGTRPEAAPEPSSAATQLGDDWVPGPDGVPFRRGARVLLLDDAARILLVRGHDMDQPDRSWWFTVGGGVDAGEAARDAAVRELFEETGLRLAAVDLVGPVAVRSATFAFLRRTVRQDEEFFLARVDGSAALTTDGWTEVERAFVDEVRWWDLDALEEVREEVFPVELVPLVRGLLGGWDGVVRQLVDER
ncbi:NUDIX domain-containing protein [Actinotalea ferrariae]|uniref:NUDIX hydrolase n=1 Tax=Actinotalea ferrariae TaxID=1386098 RepID=UPI001C8C0C46|nr:NUDIX domain-containing protein [Actinotalea ferrariae]MBX9246042.1 NUDIX domain-containing protein [Actinotalea ferrariae]